MISFANVVDAATTLAGVAHRTAVLTSRSLDDAVGATVLLKAENLQRVGAFKFRGAYNRISRLSDDERMSGVVTVSSGNHAQAVALAASLCGTSAKILMPHDAPAVKAAGVRGFGGEIVTFDRFQDDREALVRELAEHEGRVLVHPFDDPLVMAGQGTCAIELFEDVGTLTHLLVPVGGGGLIAGCATVAKAISPGTCVIGVEPAAGNDVLRSIQRGERVTIPVPETIADGQQTTAPGRLTFPVIQAHVDEIVTVTDEQIVAAMRFAFERMKIVLEPSGACALAAVLTSALDLRGGRAGVILTGGNVDLARFCALLAT